MAAASSTPRDAAVKHWCWTLNNYAPQDHESFRDTWTYDYMIIGFEVGEQEHTPHLQGYTCFTKRTRFSALKKLHPRISWKQCRGTPLQNKAYCSKSGHFEEYGTLPVTGGEAEKNRWKRIHELAKNRDEDGFFDECPQESFLHAKRFKSLTRHYNPPASSIDVLQHYWYQGPSGTGKSRVARAQYPGAYIKPTASKWWPDYDGQDVVIIDDLGKPHEYVLEWLKNWADHYPFQAESKGDHTGLIRPKHIIVTTQYSWEDISQDTELQAAIARRFTRVTFGDGMTDLNWSKWLASQPPPAAPPSTPTSSVFEAAQDLADMSTTFSSSNDYDDDEFGSVAQLLSETNDDFFPE